MRHFYALLIIIQVFCFTTADAQQPAQPAFETHCTALAKLITDFPNNFKTYLGDEIEIDMFQQNDLRFKSKLEIPNTKETFFYNELFSTNYIYYSLLYENGDSARTNKEFRKWKTKINGCPDFVFGTLAAAEGEDIREKKISWFPFDITGEMAKKYSKLVLELKVFNGMKMNAEGQLGESYSLEFRIRRLPGK